MSPHAQNTSAMACHGNQIALRLEATASRVEAIALGLE